MRNPQAYASLSDFDLLLYLFKWWDFSEETKKWGTRSHLVSHLAIELYMFICEITLYFGLDMGYKFLPKPKTMPLIPIKLS